MKSWKKPTPDKVDRAIAMLSRRMHHRYFFDHLQNAEWIRPLSDRGYFIDPPDIEKDDERGTIGFPLWPESRYLARMASHNPELVLDVILKIPETDNVRVYEDLADAALAMPPNISVKLVKKAKIWAQSPHQHFLAKKLGDLMGQLANAGMVDEALDLARTVLEVIPDPRRQQIPKDDKFSLPPEPMSKIDQWDYESILKKNIPDLISTGGVRTFDLLCDLLEQVIDLSQRGGKECAPEDYSWIWRPAIEDHPQNHHSGIKDSILTAIRAAGEAIIRNEGQQVLEIVSKLESRPWKIFKRIALHLLYRFPDDAEDIIPERLTKRELFDDTGCQYEYASLLDSCFKRLSGRHQKVILHWIEEGPNLDEFKKTQELHGNRPTDEEALHYKKYWQAKRLAWFKNSLPDGWKKQYEILIAETGEPKHPEFASYSSSWVGPTSPKDTDEIKNMSVEKITDFLRVWEPVAEPMTPSPEGLGRVLSSVISEDPERFSVEASKFVGLHPTYVRAFISGLRDSLKKNKSFDWVLVFNLCEWVLEQPREFGEIYTNYQNGDPHWGWVFKNIADLLSSGFDSVSGAIPFDFRKRVWRIIEPLTSDPEPSPEDEAQYDSPSFDPANLSINTTRGEAMHSVVRYALWLRRHIEKEPASKEKNASGFEQMPEVRSVLESHLDITLDSSLAIRSIYGQWFPWFVLLDETWSREHAGLIFPADKEFQEYWNVAWDTYITFCQAYDGVLDVLREQYKLAVDRLPEVKESKDKFERPNVRLAEHLMAFYWRGIIDLEDGENLLVKLWTKAPSDIRGRAIEYIGRSLFNTEGEVPPDTLSRLKDLWNWRFSEIQGSQDIVVYFSELEAFGWWFASGKFDAYWAINHLLKSVELTKKIDPAYRVLERLAELSDQMPFETVQCLEHICKGDKEGWKINGWRKQARVVLTKTLEAKGAAGSQAENLIHYLGERGFLEYGDLLRKS